MSCKVICILEHDSMHVSLHFKVNMQRVYAYFTLDPFIHQDIRLWLKPSWNLRSAAVISCDWFRFYQSLRMDWRSGASIVSRAFDDPALEDRSIMQTHLSCVLFSNQGRIRGRCWLEKLTTKSGATMSWSHINREQERSIRLWPKACQSIVRWITHIIDVWRLAPWCIASELNLDSH